MARRRKDKEKITDPFERARLKKLRAAQRREERKKRRAAGGDDDGGSRRQRDSAPDYSQPMVKDDYLWLRRGAAKAFANKIINDHRDRPYWLSFPYEHREKNYPPPVSHFFPCTIFRTEGRYYYGFLFREHRDLFFSVPEDARKETTDTILKLNSAVV